VNGPPVRSKLEQEFDQSIHEETLKPLLPVIQGLMRFRPSDRISISQALDMTSSISSSDNTDEETEDGMDTGIVRPRAEGLDELLKLRSITLAGARVEAAQGGFTLCEIMG
jgi:hypothetical protein